MSKLKFFAYKATKGIGEDCTILRFLRSFRDSFSLSSDGEDIPEIDYFEFEKKLKAHVYCSIGVVIVKTFSKSGLIILEIDDDATSHSFLIENIQKRIEMLIKYFFGTKLIKVRSYAV